ncbi:MAG: hypothetical protein M1822_010103 [Bathelium mastoideum]|nr:MAG: hypothetical protein M1822_010103 [Bathelium mastoideum]
MPLCNQTKGITVKLTNRPSSTNAPPIYLLLFITATYFLNRPCVYCSLLLAILVLAVFDFRGDWFEVRSSLPTSPFSPAKGSSSSSSLSSALSSLQHNATAGTEGTGLVPDSVTLAETVGMVASAVADTASSLAAAAAENVKRRVVGSSAAAGVAGAGAEGLKTVFGKREWRVPCLDILIRL